MITRPEERRHPLGMQIVVHPEGQYPGLIEFRGYITQDALMELRLDDIDKRVVHSEHRDTADWLQSLEIIFRRWAQQHPDRTSDLVGQAEELVSKYRKTWPETVEAYRSAEVPYRPYAIKPWHGNSYGPHVLAWVQSLAYDVRDRFGRPEAVRLIRLFGNAPAMSQVQPKRYEILSRALRYKLTGTDPGPATLGESESEDIGIFESEITNNG